MQDWYLVKSLCIMLVSCEGAHQNLQGLFTFALPRVLVLPVFGRESKKKNVAWGVEWGRVQRENVALDFIQFTFQFKAHIFI